MKRVIFFVLDSLGIGGAPDAADFGDEGADTLGHIAEWFLQNEGRKIFLPNLGALGLWEAHALARGGKSGAGLRAPAGLQTTFSAATEKSTGKDTPSGHWELAGVTADWDWHYFPKKEECFPSDLLAEIHARAGLVGSLGHCHASGTEILDRLGGESVKSEKPIFYTSADSVFQIAADEESFGVERLYALCEIVRELTRGMMLGRVIARPFLQKDDGFERTGNRRDYAIEPPRPTLLSRVAEAGGEVFALGKIGDIFARQGVTVEMKASGHEALWEKSREAMARAGAGDLLMTNFVDFDMLYGHRRDPKGYGEALEIWDAELGRFLSELQAGDLLVLTADHGNDPTWRGTDHTRERVPVLLVEKADGGAEFPLQNGGLRGSFCDVGATAAAWLGLEMKDGDVIEP